MRQIKSFGVLQTAKVMGAIYFFLGLLLVAIVLVLTPLRPRHLHRSPFLLLVAPAFYGVVGFIMTAIACGLYNAIARRIGGIAFEVSDEPGPPAAQ
jgi:hypothetical protein